MNGWRMFTVRSCLFCYVCFSQVSILYASLHFSLYIKKSHDLQFLTIMHLVIMHFNILSPFNFLDKTLTLLKTGAKALSYKLNASAQMDSIDLPPLRQLSPCKLKSTSNLKQMLLTDKLQLKVSNKIINVSCVYNYCNLTWFAWFCNIYFLVGYPDGSLRMLSADRSIYNKQMLLLWSSTMFFLFVCMRWLFRNILSELLSICVS